MENAELKEKMGKCDLKSAIESEEVTKLKKKNNILKDTQKCIETELSDLKNMNATLKGDNDRLIERGKYHFQFLF